MESRRGDGAWQSAGMNHTSQLRATPLHPMHLRGQHKALFTLKQAPKHSFILWGNIERMLTWLKATVLGLRVGVWRKKTRLVWYTLNDRETKTSVLWLLTIYSKTSTIRKGNTVFHRFTTGVWFVIGRDYFAWLCRCMWGRLQTKNVYL